MGRAKNRSLFATALPGFAGVGRILLQVTVCSAAAASVYPWIARRGSAGRIGGETDRVMHLDHGEAGDIEIP